MSSFSAIPRTVFSLPPYFTIVTIHITQRDSLYLFCRPWQCYHSHWGWVRLQPSQDNVPQETHYDKDTATSLQISITVSLKAQKDTWGGGVVRGWPFSKMKSSLHSIWPTYTKSNWKSCKKKTYPNNFVIQTKYFLVFSYFGQILTVFSLKNTHFSKASIFFQTDS